MKSKKKGFTLIELLAVIVILAVIALIVVPIVLNLVEKARKGAFERSAEGVLKASKLYYSSSLLNVEPMEDIRFECNNNECISNKIGESINLNVSGDTGTGYVLITKEQKIEFLLQSGKYCAVKSKKDEKATIKEQNCENVDVTNDQTPPEIKSINTIVGTNSIEVTVGAEDIESGISGYSYSIDGINYTEIQSNNVYKFEGLLKANEPYKVYVRVYNGTYGKDTYTEEKGMSSLTKEGIELEEFDAPEIKVNPEGEVWASSKTVEIIFPEGEYTKEYSIDGENNWIQYIDKIEITKETNIIARITDGSNVKIKTELVKNIERSVPTTVVLSTDSDNTYTKTKNIIVTLKDTGGSGLVEGKFKYGWSTSLDIEPSSYIEVNTSATIGENITTFEAKGSDLTGNYYLWVVPVIYKDNAENSSNEMVKSTGTFKFDNLGPVNIEASVPTDWTSGNKTITVTSASDANVGVIGGYYISTSATAPSSTATEWQTAATFSKGAGTYNIWAKDSLGNVSSSYKTVTVTNIDTANPTNVTLSANNDNTYAKTKSITVTLKDTGGSGLVAGKFKYGWSTSNSTQPSSYTEVSTSVTSGTNTTTFKANGSGLTGDYYLWVVPVTYKDNAGRSNTTTVKSTGTFKFDNLGPVVTLSSATVTTNSITVPYTSVDGNVGTIGSTICVYGKTTSYGSTGTVSGGKCVMSNLDSSTTYYYKITSTDSLGNSTTNSVKTGSATTASAVNCSAVQSSCYSQCNPDCSPSCTSSCSYCNSSSDPSSCMGGCMTSCMGACIGPCMTSCMGDAGC